MWRPWIPVTVGRLDLLSVGRKKGSVGVDIAVAVAVVAVVVVVLITSFSRRFLSRAFQPVSTTVATMCFLIITRKSSAFLVTRSAVNEHYFRFSHVVSKLASHTFVSYSNIVDRGSLTRVKYRGSIPPLIIQLRRER